jgi:hypothetical protein
MIGAGLQVSYDQGGASGELVPGLQLSYDRGGLQVR